MLRKSTRFAALTGTVLLIAACGRSEPEAVVFTPEPTPIYTKDGRVIDQPMVSNQNM